MVTNRTHNRSSTAAPRQPKIRVGVSSCLLGAKVRFDGNSKHHPYLTETLGRFFDLVPVCPEVGIGLGVPREPIRLVGDARRLRAVGVRDVTHDVTDRLAAYGRRMARTLGDVSGYIFKGGSPSCGVESVKVSGAGCTHKGRGVYAAAFLEAHPLLPVTEEGCLGDLVLQDNFLERVFAYNRWQRLAASRLTAAKLVEFHSAHKLCVMAHSQRRYQSLGRLVAGAGQQDFAALKEKYICEFMGALRRRATPESHSNVLMHLMGYLKKQLDARDKAELLALFDDYRCGRVPLVVPATVLRHHFRRYPNPYVASQIYLYPSAAELLLRSGTCTVPAGAS
ncbi:MAG: YbgA family protein [Acidiferrobacterales bacterium]